ncbi:Mitochondrial import receptor subunit tom22-like protein [Elsinoe fawcettii]|nr:Mitochondrial import receptor subunit tom22-like protein [Elsinoe fawcettii]
MVKLEEVLDESFREDQPGPRDDEDWDTDSGTAEVSDASSTSDIDEDESLLDRLAALKDIIPPTARKSLSNTFDSASSLVKSGISIGGKTLWVVSTSVLLVGVPWALALAEEQQMEMMEREMKAQERAGEMLTQPAGGEAKAAL